jgi:tetratricopeptide (TPR) repeat protein
LLEASLPIAQKAGRLCPKNADCLLVEGLIYSELLEAFSGMDTAKALRYGQLETQSFERALKAFPRNMQIQLELATAYSQEAKMWNMRSGLAEAAERYHHAIALREAALSQNPTDVLTRRSLMITYGNLGGNLGNPLYQNLGDFEGAREYYGKALAIARDLAKADNDNVLAQYDLAQALFLYSILEFPKEEWPASLELLRESDRIFQKLLATDPKAASRLRPLAGVVEYEGRRLEGLGKRSEAIVEYRRSVSVAEKALERDASDLSAVSQLLVSQEALAEALAHEGDRATALSMAQAAVARAERVSIEGDRGRMAPYVPMAYLSLASIHEISGNWKEARTAVQRSVDEYHKLAASGRRIKTAELSRAEALLQECAAHLR